MVFVKLHADEAPTRDNLKYLSNTWTREAVYNQYVAHCLTKYQDTELGRPLSLTYVNRIWREEFGQVRVSKWKPFARCADCDELDAAQKSDKLNQHEKGLSEQTSQYARR